MPTSAALSAAGVKQGYMVCEGLKGPVGGGIPARC